MDSRDLPDHFPGFSSRKISLPDGDVFCRVGGSGPPLLLLHGYPQSHVMWHKIAPALSEQFTVILADLPGYGQSDCPPLSADHSAYSKRTMAKTMVQLMADLGHETFYLAGHDRGGRVSYRMALDHPQNVKKLAVLDILPTFDYWAKMDREFALKVYHWAFLAQQAPFPENLISASAISYLEHTLASWTASKDLSAFSEEALAHYRVAFSNPCRVAASCEDYRAGATIDLEHDSEDREKQRKISCPTLVLWGNAGIASSASTPLDTWQDWANSVIGTGISSGHFLPEEAPKDTLQKMKSFFKSNN